MRGTRRQPRPRNQSCQRLILRGTWRNKQASQAPASRQLHVLTLLYLKLDSQCTNEPQLNVHNCYGVLNASERITCDLACCFALPAGPAAAHVLAPTGGWSTHLLTGVSRCSEAAENCKWHVCCKTSLAASRAASSAQYASVHRNTRRYRHPKTQLRTNRELRKLLGVPYYVSWDVDPVAARQGMHTATLMQASTAAKYQANTSETAGACSGRAQPQNACQDTLPTTKPTHAPPMLHATKESDG